MQSQADTLPASPYVGLVPYTEDEAPFFFGRDQERRDIIANLLTSRLTLLFGPSGVGKSSILRAGVLNDLRREALESLREEGKADFIPVYFAAWQDDPVAGLANAVREAAHLVYGDQAASGERVDSRSLVETVERWAGALNTDLLVILDQFEEFFSYHGEEDDAGGRFIVELSRVMTASGLRARFLLSIREDALGQLDRRFKRAIPHLFATRYRIDHLDLPAARQAIVRPIEQHNVLSPGAEPIVIEPELVDGVLEDVVHRRPSNESGQAGVETATESRADRPRVLAADLQLVMSKIWDAERASGSRILRAATLERLGGSEGIWTGHLDHALASLTSSQRRTAAEIFRYLVTPAGTKYAVTAADLAAHANVPAADATDVVEFLANRQQSILRPVEPPEGQTQPRYEIFHDLLAQAVLDWRRRHAADARMAATRRRALIAVGSVIFAAAIFGWIVVKDRDENLSRELATTARAQAAVNPESALLNALTAWETAQTSEAEEALRLASSELSSLISVVRHEEAVWSSAFSPDGARLVTASADGTAIVADAETGDTLVELRGHTDEIGRAAFTPDGTRVVTASLDDTARVWDAATGEIQVSLEHDSDVYLASTPLAPDGRYVLTVAGLAAWIWDVDSGELAAKLEHPDEAIAVLDAAFSPDGSLVATAANDGKARIWELQPPGSATLPTMRPELDNLTTAVRMVAFSPDGSLLAAANSDGSVGVWDVETGANLDFEQNHYDDVVTVAFSPDGGQILAVAEKTMTILQIEEVVDEESEPTVELYRYVEPSASWTNAAAWSPDGRQIVTAHQDGTARVFDVGTGQELMALRGHHNIVWTAAFSPDGDRIVTASEDGSARVWSVTSGADLVLEGHSWPVTSADFSPDGRRVVTAGVDETAIVWDAQSGELLHELEGDDSEFGFYPMWSAVFSRDGAEVLTAQETEIRTDEPTLSGAVARWDADSGRRLGICCTHPDGWPAVGADFVPGPRDRVVVFYGDSSVHLWSLVDDRDEWSTTGVIAAAVSPDGGQLVTIGRDKMAVVWDLESFERVREWETGLVSGLDFAPDGALVTAGLDGVIRVWDLRTPNAANETPSVRVEIQGSPGGTVITVGNSGDRSWIVAGGPDGLTKIFDAATGHLLGQLRMHSGAINSVSIADDGRIATASDDLTAKVYQCSVCGPIDTIVERARAMRDRLDDADE